MSGIATQRDLEYESWFRLWNGDPPMSPADRICWSGICLWALWSPWLMVPMMMYNREGLYNYPHKVLHNSLTCLTPDYCPFHQGHTGNLLAFRTTDRLSWKICPWENKLSLYTKDRLKYSLNTSASDLTQLSTGGAHTDRGSGLPSLSLN